MLDAAQHRLHADLAEEHLVDRHDLTWTHRGEEIEHLADLQPRSADRQSEHWYRVLRHREGISGVVERGIHHDPDVVPGIETAVHRCMPSAGEPQGRAGHGETVPGA